MLAQASDKLGEVRLASFLKKEKEEENSKQTKKKHDTYTGWEEGWSEGNLVKRVMICFNFSSRFGEIDKKIIYLLDPPGSQTGPLSILAPMLH